MSLGAIVTGPNSQYIAEKFDPAIELLLKLLEYKEKKIRQTTGWLFVQLATACAELFNRTQIIRDIYQIANRLLNSDEVVGGQMAIFFGKLSIELQPAFG